MLRASKCRTTASSWSTTTGTASSSATSLEENSENCRPEVNKSWQEPKTLVRCLRATNMFIDPLTKQPQLLLSRLRVIKLNI